MTGDSDKRQGRIPAYVSRIIESARTLRERGAFEPPPRVVGDAISAAMAKAGTRAQGRDTRTVVMAFALATAFIAALSLCLPYRGIDTMGYGGTIYSPTDVLDCYRLWFDLNVAPLFDNTLYNLTALKLAQFAETHEGGMYTMVTNRAMVTAIVVICGMMLAVSGLLFQTSFRNPLATPSMLGVSDGVTLGCIVFAWLGNGSISEDPVLYLLCVYGFGAATVLVVLLLSRGISGGARYNVFDMLLLGTVITQLLGGVNAFVQNFVMDYGTWQLFYDVQQATDALREPLVRQVVVAVFVLTLLPALVLRFRLNLIAFSNDEGRMMGVRTGVLRGLALVLGASMQLAAIASIGPVAMLSLAVPFLVRYLMPSDFRSQFLGNCLIGTALLLTCMLIQHFAVIDIITVPVGTIVSLLIIPFFVWVVALGRGRW
ncbi:MAG: iron ABC transporter permease [Coriobacteriales bacterium]|nr:iron ABC transporter permease [Coriobacteriales bacterium]